MYHIVLKSPNNEHKANLLYKDEIRFGPSYYILSIDKKPVNDRIFGDEIKWSNDSKYLASQEWLTTDYQAGPITRLALFDIINNKLSLFSPVNKGFVKGFVFEDSKLIYKKSYSPSGKIEEVEVKVDINQIANWEDLQLPE